MGGEAFEKCRGLTLSLSRLPVTRTRPRSYCATSARESMGIPYQKVVAARLIGLCTSVLHCAGPGRLSCLLAQYIQTCLPHHLPLTISTSASSPLHKTMPSLSRADQSTQDISRFEDFLSQHPHIEYIWLQWLDYSATQRSFMIPVLQFREQLETRKWAGVHGAIRSQLDNNSLAPGGVPTGQHLLAPDLSALTPNSCIESPSATVQSWWMEDTDGDSQAVHLAGCPRWTLQHCLDTLEREYSISVTMGFEVEVVFVRPILDGVGNDVAEYRSLPTLHPAYGSSYQQLDYLPVIEDVVRNLRKIGIHLPTFHAEVAPGQWEFVLPPHGALKAVDTYYQARSVIQNVARHHKLKATFYPRPYDSACGSASHMHISIKGSGESRSTVNEHFLAGVIERLPPVLSFTLSMPESYSRVGASIFGGGEYIAWGVQNREVPLRQCGAGHWEFRAIDGMGNMYLSAAAFLTAGLCGLRQDTALELKDCALDPSKMIAVERRELGIVHKLPDALDKSLAALEQDKVFTEELGTTLVERYLAVKRAQVEALNDMAKDERRRYLIGRY